MATTKKSPSALTVDGRLPKRFGVFRQAGLDISDGSKIVPDEQDRVVYKKKSWEPFVSQAIPSPPASMEAVLKAREAMERERNPFVVMNGGLREGDNLVIDWMSPKDPRLNGCRVAVYRAGKLIRWTSDGWLRDAGGRCLYAPYLTSSADLGDFVFMLAMACGYQTKTLEETPMRVLFELTKAVGDNRRIVRGDCIRFDWQKKAFQVQRSQGTVDMNLYRPKPDEGGVVMGCSVSYINLPHHTTVIARAMAEANGLLLQVLGHDVFMAVSR